MRERIAEWILEIVLSPDRAAAMVGDWTEETKARGTIWFWSCVFRTLFACIWRDLSGNPLTMARLGLSGFVRNLRVALGFQGAIFVLLLWPYHGDSRYRHDWIWNTLMVNHAKNPAPPQHSLRWQIEMIWLLLYWARLVQTARWLVRRAPGREVAGCISIVLPGFSFHQS